MIFLMKIFLKMINTFQTYNFPLKLFFPCFLFLFCFNFLTSYVVVVVKMKYVLHIIFQAVWPTKTSVPINTKDPQDNFWESSLRVSDQTAYYIKSCQIRQFFSGVSNITPIKNPWTQDECQTDTNAITWFIYSVGTPFLGVFLFILISLVHLI